MTNLDTAGLLVAAMAKPTDAALESLRPHLADGVTQASPLATVTGPDAVLEALRSPQATAAYSQAEWSDPVADVNHVTFRATLPPSMPIGGIDFRVSFAKNGRIESIDLQFLAAGPAPVADLALTDEIRSAVDGALLNRTPVLVAYVDADGWPHLSLRGTTQVFSPTQLAMWIRDPEGGILKAIPNHPEIALWYRDPANRTTFQFAGRARVDDDEAVRAQVFDNSPEPERNFDPQRRGVAVIIDLERVEGSTPAGRVVMARKP